MNLFKPKNNFSFLFTLKLNKYSNKLVSKYLIFYCIHFRISKKNIVADILYGSTTFCLTDIAYNYLCYLDSKDKIIYKRQENPIFIMRKCR